MNDTEESPTLSDRISASVFSGLMRVLRALPYERRVALAGRAMSGVIAPLAGWRRRVRVNLGMACPDLPASEVERLVRRVPDNIGRSLAEIYSGDEFLERVRDLPLTGPGAAHLEALRAEGKSAVLVTGHFGNYDAWRGALHARGYRIGALYRPMNNRAFNAQYVEAIEGIAEPLFSRDKRGMARMLRYLRDGGMVGLAIDQYFKAGAPCTFFGLEAKTPLSAAELALKYDVPMIPIFAVRQEDGLSFSIEVEEAIPPSGAETMSQLFNDALERKVRAHMDQWFWIHRRWKKRAPRG
ncbi:lysophospholipid acyltransferase family protein [Sedimentimonas flavescens]|uniref:lysophospholipid acyltransferase family protein n=1 Tax=Sedimentimonas flavescens TaxID=2851012 RepID=UPI001C4A3CC3|nr:lysophospholipid acyltransferase family protein [Sedimentimonas flavescens]MBW0157823.1 lysophospholipid acyltransferase family protein [Sedimentimonas flavescens]